MATTNIPSGNALAIKLQSIAIFALTIREPSFRRDMTAQAPQQADAEAKLKGQTSPDYPVVRVTDLSKSRGDKVSVDLVNIISGKPVMGDQVLTGRGMSLTFSSMDIAIDQCRAMVNPGGRMTQQRTAHDLDGLARANLAGYFARLEDQLALVHLAGARGYDDARDWAIPLASDADFASIMVNSVLPPTRNRRFFAGDATSVANISAEDILGLTDIDRLRVALDELTHPLQPIKLQNEKGEIDPVAYTSPLYCLYVSPRVWHWIQTNTTDPAWRTFLQNAVNRNTQFRHPLFTGDTGMWNGILIKKMSRAIRFTASSTVKEYDTSDVAQDITAALTTDRSLLLGAQALAEAYGQHKRSGFFYSWNKEETDHGNTVEVSIATMGGKAKVRFSVPNASGALELTDHGVMTIDSYAPNPNP